MKYTKRIFSILLSVTVLFVFSATFAMAATVKTPKYNSTIPVGSTVTVSVVTTDYTKCKENKNYCNFSVFKDDDLILEKNVSYKKKGKKVSYTFTVKEPGTYGVFVFCYCKKGGKTVLVEDAQGYILGGNLLLFSDEVTFDVNDSMEVDEPGETAISSLKAKSMGFTAKWKKTSCSGYQIRYSTSSSMSSAKKVTISGQKNLSKTVEKLKKSKKYYVQIRTYTSLGSGVKYYSNWSDTKSIKTK